MHPRKFELQPIERGIKCLGGFIKDGEMQYTGSLDDFRDHYKDVGVTLEDIIVHVERRPLDEGAII